MTLFRNLFFLFSITVFATASTVLAIFNYDPNQADTLAFANFYASFLVSIAGILSIAFYYTKIKLSRNETIFGYFWPSVRQATFIATALTAILYLKGLGILDWLIGVSVIIVTILLELFFESKKVKNKATKE